MVRLFLLGLGAGLSAVCGTQAPAAPAPIEIVKRVGTPGVRDVPYTLMEKITTARTLADGSTVTEVSLERHERDGKGRERTESGILQDGKLVVDTVTIKDYGTWTLTTLNLRNSTAEVKGLNASFAPPPPARTPEQIAAAQEKTAALREFRRTHPDRLSKEPLPAETVAGVSVEGIRSIRTIPAGAEDNDRDITVISDSWPSPELKVVLLNKFNDPRTGTVTREVIELQRGEPDQALFQVPPGYEVVHAPARAEPKPNVSIPNTP